MNLLGNNAKQISLLKDPFKSDFVTDIYMYISKSVWSSDNGKITYRATVEFKNGNTTGKQQIVAEDFNSLVLSVESFIKSL